MPWYWTDEIAEALIRLDRLSAAARQTVGGSPVAIRRSEPTVEEAATALQDEGEIPLAA